MENKIQELADLYKIEYPTLVKYADEGCRCCFQISLDEYLQKPELTFNTEADAEEFLEAIIATGMAEQLHDVVQKQPFKKIHFPKP